MAGATDDLVGAISRYAIQAGPRVPDRGRHPRCGRRVGGARQDGGQGRRGRQAHLPVAVRTRASRAGWPPSASRLALAALDDAGLGGTTAGDRAAGSSAARIEERHTPRLAPRRARPRRVARARPCAHSRRRGARQRPAGDQGRQRWSPADADVDAQRARSSVRRARRPQAGARARRRFASTSSGRAALDIGASTGGFTDVLLQRGAARVVALDVGHGQLDWRLRSDPRVVVLERVNARHLTPDQLPPDLRRFDIVTIDVSFISLRHILPVLGPLLRPGAHGDRARQAAVRGGPRRGGARRHRARRCRAGAGGRGSRGRRRCARIGASGR